ncbi:hypothetical protein JQ621_31440 [Bradyrhizobium manausense]|uniref:hypothetical protein n=1 Tax=Bradyrhizobium manausense TaxID=989370 RepID=UPI001BAA54B0|nr:hypothetical protein [Bradyrhizobium manausense]MBR1091996.1 hypothetical protein [Bradyrhizobium manausense]
MSNWSLKAGFAGVVIVAATAYALAQMPDHARMRGTTGNPDQQHMMQPGMHDQMMQGRHGTMGGQPAMPGQEAFGTIQEIVRILEADPKTDWSKVNISALRQHLIDMDEVTMRASATERALDNGIEIAVTGEGRTLDGIKRMVPAHVRELSQLGWNAKSEDLSNGVKLTVTSTDAKEVTKLKALGFMGIMVQGAHHQQHHLMMAKGEFSH